MRMHRHYGGRGWRIGKCYFVHRNILIDPRLFSARKLVRVKRRQNIVCLLHVYSIDVCHTYTYAFQGTPSIIAYS